MSTQNSSGRVSRWQKFRSHLPPIWETRAALIVVLAFVGLAVAQIENPWLMFEASLAVSLAIFLMIFAMLSARERWVARWRNAEKADTWLSKAYVTVPTLMGLSVVLILSSVFLDRIGAVRIGFLHPDYKVLSPAICVNGAPTLGFVGPYPEVLDVNVDAISSVGVCHNMPQLSFGLEISGIRVDSLEKGGDNLTFEPPLDFPPGAELGVVLVGRETAYYRQTNSPYYLIRRKWGGYGDILKFLQSPNPGFSPLDWNRMQSVGLRFDDNGKVFPDGSTDAIYAHYFDDTGGSPVLVNFRGCARLEGNIMEFMKSDYSSEHHHISLSVPSGGGQVNVVSWQTGVKLMTCYVR